mmetsp:Transcript_2378/g.6874  ORF Transcript_2378/g.6874 Transcript_2378/m.6874 type:complete len:82 (-) Transcript_2378:331-576(-)
MSYQVVARPVIGQELLMLLAHQNNQRISDVEIQPHGVGSLADRLQFSKTSQAVQSESTEAVCSKCSVEMPSRKHCHSYEKN